MWDELWGWLRHRGDTDLELNPQDRAELEAAALRVASEFAGSAPEVIVATAAQLLHRQVPIRGVAGAALAPGVAELRFADGTVVIVRAQHPGDLGKLAVWRVHGRVSLLGWVTSTGTVCLEVGEGEHRLRVIALGVRRPT